MLPRRLGAVVAGRIEFPNFDRTNAPSGGASQPQVRLLALTAAHQWTEDEGEEGVMAHFDVVSEFPEAAAVVLSDDAGALLEWSGDIDGEAAGAVHAFTQQSLSQAGELLGLGIFERATIVGAAQACVLARQGGRVLAVYAASGRPLAALEKRVDATLRK